MTTKAAFNAEEWTTVATAPVLAAMLVITADKGGTVRESVAISRGYQAARDNDPGPLLAEILATPPTIDRTKARSPDDVRREAPAALRSAIRIMERLTTDPEVVEYKRFVYGLAETVARAHREGGFLGIGGQPISASEQAALDAIAEIFDEPRPADAPARPAETPAPAADEAPAPSADEAPAPPADAPPPPDGEPSS
jgi:hypothetical protein